jgi:hypothetical protein
MARHMGWNNWNAANGFFGQGPGGRRDALLNGGGGGGNPPVSTLPIGGGNGGNGGGNGGNGGNGGGGGARHRNQGDSLAHERNPFSIVQPTPTANGGGVQLAPTAPPGGGFVQFANSLGLGGPGSGALPTPDPGAIAPGSGGSGGGIGGPPGVYSTSAANTGGTDTSGWLFDPNSTYGGTTYNPGDWINTDIGNKQFQDDPSGAWQYWIAQNGIDPMSQRGQTARSLLSRVNDAYDAATLDNPMLQRRDFLRGVDPNALLANMSASERGETPGRFQGRARTISRGYGGG